MLGFRCSLFILPFPFLHGLVNHSLYFAWSQNQILSLLPEVDIFIEDSMRDVKYKSPIDLQVMFKREEVAG